MDEWLRYTYSVLLEVWQQEIVPDLLAGRAVSMTVHAVANQPLKFDCQQNFKDRSRPVDYRVQLIAPVNPYLCPGDQLRYPVVLEVRETPVVLTITEAWCRVGADGVCDRGSTVVYNVPVLRPRYIDTIAGRTMPDTPFFRAGDQLELHHATTNGDDVTGYVVAPIVVRDNCTPAAGGAGGD